MFELLLVVVEVFDFLILVKAPTFLEKKIIGRNLFFWRDFSLNLLLQKYYANNFQNSDFYIKI